MDVPFDPATAAGLTEALRLDPTLVGEPERLRRALADLAPRDERGGWLLTLAAVAGIPALVAGGFAAEAHARLADLTACRADAAAWTVTTWARALGTELPDHAVTPDDGADADFDGVADLPAEEPGTPTALSVALWPDGNPVLAAVTMQGVFVVTGGQAPGRWRRVATVRAPLSRDVALVLETAPGRVLWTDHDGVWSRALRRDGTRLVLGEPSAIAIPPSGGQARYPLAALGEPSGGSNVLWTSDRLSLALTEDCVWGSATRTAPVPPAPASGERLDGLQWCLETEQTGWLLCRTDRARLLAASWDQTVQEAGHWTDLAPPAAAVAAALACVGEQVFAVAVTQHGDLLSLALRQAAHGAGEWHSIDRPAQVRAAPPVRVLAAAARWERPDLPGWLAVAGPGGSWIMPLTRSGEHVECGAPVHVWTGE